MSVKSFKYILVLTLGLILSFSYTSVKAQENSATVAAATSILIGVVDAL